MSEAVFGSVLLSKSKTSSADMFINSQSLLPETNSGLISFIANGRLFMLRAYHKPSMLANEPSAEMCPQPSLKPFNLAKSWPTSSSI